MYDVRLLLQKVVNRTSNTVHFFMLFSWQQFFSFLQLQQRLLLF